LLANASKLWNTEQGKAIDYGNLLHEIFAKIRTEKDIDKIVEQYKQQGILDEVQTEQIRKSVNNVVNHQKIKDYFSENVTVFNEREIVDVDNQILIPDRLVFTDNNDAIIIDYKTGNPSSEHHQQLLRYERVLKSMNFKVDKKLLIYINEEIDVVEV
jgi:RecB family exonuclease